jgi:hypothetical protein
MTDKTKNPGIGIPRVATVVGLLKEEYTGELRIDEGDERFKCSCCSKDIKGGRYHSMYVDSHHMIWCRTCRNHAEEPCIRAVDKNPNDEAPKIFLRGGNYYRRMKRKNSE